MAANENALTQPKYELGICSIIQNVFQGDYTTKPKIEKLLEKNLLFPMGGYPSMENSMKINNIYFEPFPYWL